MQWTTAKLSLQADESSEYIFISFLLFGFLEVCYSDGVQNQQMKIKSVQIYSLSTVVQLQRMP